jgi:hypothetical protein
LPDLTPLNFFSAEQPAPDPAFLAALPADTLLSVRHLTTFDDEGESLRKFGLLNLRGALTQATPLHRFLADNGLTFDPDTRLIRLNGKEIHLFDCLENCASCLNDKAVCRLYDRANKAAFSRLYPHLFEDAGEPAVYLYYPADTDVSILPGARCPQVLTLLDEMLESLGTPLDLEMQWAERHKGKYHVVEFTVQMDNMMQVSEKQRVVQTEIRYMRKKGLAILK